VSRPSGGGLRRRRASGLVLAGMLALLGVLAVATGRFDTRLHSTSFAGALEVQVETAHPQASIPSGAIGLSTETSELGDGHLTATHRRLVALMRMLGPAVLRIGGDSVDESWWTAGGEAAPSWARYPVVPADLVRLRGLLHAADWRVVLGLDLAHYEPARAAQEAAQARGLLGDRLLAVEVGNEPNGYSGESSTHPVRADGYGPAAYLSEFDAYARAIEHAVPGLPVVGPAVSGTRWLTEMGAEASAFAQITEHYYYAPPGASCAQLAPHATGTRPTVGELLTRGSRQQEEETLAALHAVAGLAQRGVAIDETGTGRCNGSSPSAATFASALWALDFSLRALTDGVQQLNFHGRFGVCEPDNQTPLCAATSALAARGGLTARPEFYGLLAASRFEGTRALPCRLSIVAGERGLSAWAGLTRQGKVEIALINLATAGGPLRVRVPLRGYGSARVLRLTASSAYAHDAVKLGGASLAAGRRWRPRAQPLRSTDGSFTLTLPPASAAIVTASRT
jgi:hypothetical protein